MSKSPLSSPVDSPNVPSPDEDFAALFAASEQKGRRSKIEVGDRGTDSPALQNHKAFLFSKDRNLLVLPILEAQIDPSKYVKQPPANAYGDYVRQGAYVFDISPGGITLRGIVTHLKGDELLKSGYWFNSEYSVERSLYIGNVLYTVSGRMIKANSLTNLKELASVELK